MIGYAYIQQLFQYILDNSTVIDGRFYVCPKWGAELSNPNIEEQLSIGQQRSQKYPAALLMPPALSGNFEDGALGNSNSVDNYDMYNIKIIFGTTPKVTGQNQPQTPNALGTPQHTVVQTWHDMLRVAKNFSVVLNNLCKQTGGMILFWDRGNPTSSITPITDLGNDKVCGVILAFNLALYSGCTIEDYPDDWATTLTPPALTDNHPLHPM